jgi:hypothetical protein
MEALVPSGARGPSRRFAQWVAACATAAIGLIVTSIPASADQNGSAGSGGVGKKTPTVLVTLPLFLESQQTFLCSVVNMGTAPQEVTVTLHSEFEFSGTTVPDSVLTVTLAPGPAKSFGFTPPRQSVHPVPNFCKFESTDTSALRAGASIVDGGHVVRYVGAE